MKLNKYIWLAAMPMLFAACQNDTLGEELQQKNGIYTLSGKMADGAAMSRAQVVLGNTDSSRESFMWNEDDAFALYQGDYNSLAQHVFTISSDYTETGTGDKKSAAFTTDNPAQAMKYTAIYPAHVQVNGADAQFSFQTELDFTAATTQEEQNLIWGDYLQNNMFMMAKGELTGDGDNVLNFQHLCAMARITYTNQTDATQTFDYIRLGSGQQITTNISYNVIDQSQSGSGTTSWYQISTSGLTVAAGESTDFYIMFFPSDFNLDGIFQIALNFSGKGEMYAEIPVADIATANAGDTGFTAGKRYWFKLTAKEDALYLTKDLEIVTIENTEFSAVLANILDDPEEVTINENGYAEMTRAYAKSITDLQFGWQGYVVPSLAGIEHFVNLESLGCANSGIVSCDLSNNTKLINLVIDWNENLTELDLSKNLKLGSLLASFNKNLSSLTLPMTNTLWSLSVEHTALPSLDVPNPSNIEYLTCGNNAFTSLNLSGFTNLREINIANLGLENIDFIPVEVRSQLRVLNCDRNTIGTLNLSAYTSLERLVCGKQLNKWLVLTLPDDKKGCWNNEWKNDDGNVFVYLSGETMPETVTFENTEMAKALKHALGEEVLLFEDCTAVMYKSVVESKEGLSFYGYSGSYTTLAGIEAFINLKHLICVENDLVSLDVSAFKNLEVLECRDNKLETLVVNGSTSLRELQCFGNALTFLDISELSQLEVLVCGNQKNEKTLSLTLTEEQKTSWDNEWLKNNAWGNQNVALDVVDSGVSGKDELSKNVIVKTAGTLSTFINDDEKYVITSLAISGPLNGDDIQFIRDIIFTSSSGNPTESTGALHTLDLSNAQIVAGGGAYNAYRPDETVNTQDNIVTAGMFGYSNLRTIVLSSNITEIGESAFETMLSLESIAIPVSVTKIGEKALNTCKKLKSITVSENVIEIGSHAFASCMALTEVIIPSNVATIGSYVFGNCANLTKVYCKALTPPALGVNAFSLCSSLQTVYVPASAVDAYNNADGWKNFQIVVE